MLLSQRVLFGSFEHLLPIALAIILTILLIRFSLNQEETVQYKIFKYLGVFVSGFMLIFHLYQIGFEDYNITSDLPLFLCSFMALFIFVFTTSRKYWLFEILLFWIILGTSQGVITPDIEVGFPSFDYFRYWIVHLGLLTIISYSIVVLKMKPKLKSVFKSFLVLQFYMIVLMVVNYLLEANYSYLNEKPISGSVLDYLGDWPYYIIKVQLLLVPAFMLIYLPFFFLKKKEKLN